MAGRWTGENPELELPMLIMTQVTGQACMCIWKGRMGVLCQLDTS